MVINIRSLVDDNSQDLESYSIKIHIRKENSVFHWLYKIFHRIIHKNFFRVK